MWKTSTMALQARDPPSAQPDAKIFSKGRSGYPKWRSTPGHTMPTTTGSRASTRKES